MVAIDIVEHGD